MAYFQVAWQESKGAPATDAVATRSFFVQLCIKSARIAVSILGPEALGLSAATPIWLEAFSEPIAGGTVDIQKNIIGEHVLGLPR